MKTGYIAILVSIISFGLSLANNNSFGIGIENEANQETQTKCQESLDDIDLNIDTSEIVTDIRLPFQGLYETAITWVSSDTEVISIDTTKTDAGKVADIIGKVARPSAGNVNVVLTATAVIDGDYDFAASKDFAVTVLKASTDAGEEEPLAFSEDFSSYATGIDLSNYYKWQLTNGDQGVAQVVHELPNINNMISESALRVTSGKAASDDFYDARINVTAAKAPSGAVFEGYMMFTGQTNGLDFEILSGSSRIAAFGMSSTAYSYDGAGSYVNVTDTKPEEGVWQKFRVLFRPKSGYFAFSIYDWQAGSYIDLTSEASYYLAGAGVSSGAKGDATTLRIRARSGVSVGATYISDLKIDLPADLPIGTVSNPNRAEGLGLIEGYDETILAYKNQTVSGLSPDFIVHNRFDAEEIFKNSIDYTVSQTSNSNEDGSVVSYMYLFTLLKTGETKTVTQTVYFDDAANTAQIYGFKASYLKAVSGQPSLGQITLTGNVIRTDSTLYYLVMKSGSIAPEAGEIIDQAHINGFVTGGSASVSERSFSLTTAPISISDEYDVYAVTDNATGVSAVYSAPEISTVINISTAEDFYDMAVNVETKDSSFRLISDIDFSDFNWVYDSTTQMTFDGVFDGQGHTISNLRIDSPTEKVGIFYNFKGIFENVTFEKAYVSGWSDVGVIAGNIYGGEISQVNFADCKVDLEASVTGGAGYFGIVAGRLRANSTSINNINITGAEVDCPQYCGILTGGIGPNSDGTVYCDINNIYAEGTIDTDGAAVGLIGRNRGTTTINNGVVYLNIANAKKEVGVVAGHNKEGGKLIVNNFVGDLKIQQITQVIYFNNFIGSHDANTSSYKASNVFFIKEDYSNLADSIVPDVKAINIGKEIDAPEIMSQKWWETQTFFRDLDISASWAYDSAAGRPYVKLRSASGISFTIEQFEDMVGNISDDADRILDNHYYIYKAYDMLDYMTEEQKELIPAAYVAKLSDAKAAYDQAVSDTGDISGGLDGTIAGAIGGGN